MLTISSTDTSIVDIHEYEDRNLDFSLGYREPTEFTCSTDDIECSICYTVYDSPILLECKHTFCINCLDKIDNQMCPLCRKDYAHSPITRDYKVASCINNMVIKCGTCKQTHAVRNACKFYCLVCNHVVCGPNKRNHIYNECNGNGMVKYCFVCNEHVIKSRYDEHKRVCYDHYFHKQFIMLSLYDEANNHETGNVSRELAYERVKHLLGKDGQPKIYFLQGRIRLHMRLQTLKGTNNGGIRFGGMDPEALDYESGREPQGVIVICPRSTLKLWQQILQYDISNYIITPLPERKMRTHGWCDVHGSISKFRSVPQKYRSREGDIRSHNYLKRYGIPAKCSCYE